MTDMLVKLYNLPAQETAAVELRPAMAAEKRVVVDWVAAHFGEHWAGECDVAFARQPIACVIAVDSGQPVGFACYDVTSKGFFGPTGVLASHQGRGIGKALLLAALHAMKAQGYAYAIIGGVGPAEFYEKAVGAVVIPDSTPGIYPDLLQRHPLP